MTRILAALDSSAAAQPVLETGAAVATLIGAELRAVHVQEDEGDAIVRSVAGDVEVPLDELEGSIVDTLADMAEAEDVALVVLGARATPGGARPAGSTAIAVATRITKPVVLVPPETAHPGRMRRILVPLEGTLSTSLAPRRIIELAGKASLEVIALHVLDEASLPSFTDQPQHEADAWTQEFLARFCPFGVDSVSLEVRVGRREELIPQVAQELDADLIALGWSKELAPDRAPVVRAVLERGHLPVLLVPVASAAGRSETSTTLRSSRV